MSKVIVIGCGAGSIMAKIIAKRHIGEEVIFYADAKDVPIEYAKLPNLNCISTLHESPIVEMPVIKEKKPSHRITYKYHK